MTLNAKIWGLVDFLAISDCDTSQYHLQGGTTELPLCDPDGEFGICILTLRECKQDSGVCLLEVCGN